MVKKRTPVKQENSYADFLKEKSAIIPEVGHEVGELPEVLYPFQEALTRWAIRRGRAAIFADCGLGKTLVQLIWAQNMGEKVLIVAPLAVAEQTIEEARSKLNLEVRKVAIPSGLPGIEITNYEKLHHFIGADYDSLVLDESGILKSLSGKTRTLILSEFTHIPYRLACSATPAPNDISELANHAEFLGIMKRQEMLATFFVHDPNGGEAWRLKGYAQDKFWCWIAQWAAYIRKPSDLGFDDGDFIIPGLNIIDGRVDSDFNPDGTLFHIGLGGINERRAARRDSLLARVICARDMIIESNKQWLVWCGLNAEGDALEKELGDICVQVAGVDNDEKKIEKELLWRTGKVRVMITKSKIFGFGMNWQHCSNVLFLGLGDSYEQYYQAVRRCWRFGQKNLVNVVILTSSVEEEVVQNVRRKEAQAALQAAQVIAYSKEAMMKEVLSNKVADQTYTTHESTGEGWQMLMGDCIERIHEISDASIGMSLFSPPFASLYTYSASDRDLGNSRDYDQFFEHFKFLTSELLRITMAGRRCCVHVQQIATTKQNQGIIGWRDFRADVVRLLVSSGWVYDGEVVIDKDPQAQAIRTKSKALMFVQKNKDSSWLRPAMADYIICFRHPGDNQVPIIPDISNNEWIEWARPIWYGIRESDTLSFTEVRAEKDERHICPLQLGTIERCIRLWSNKGEIVFSPFAGIGSEGYVALRQGRRFIGIELKEAYYQQAVRNLKGAIKQLSLFEDDSENLNVAT